VNPSDPTQGSRSPKTVTVHVKLADFLARLTPEKKFDIAIPAGSTVAEFIEALAEHLGGNFRRALLEKNGRLHADYAIVLDRQFIPPGQITEYKIRQSCGLSIIPIAGGG
jgi:sulfur carrier protein ThiS